MDGDEGFGSFVTTHERGWIRTAYLLTGDQQLAEDLLQTVLARLARRWQRLNEPDAAGGYVRTALFREYVSWRRLRRNSEIPTEVLPDRAGLAPGGDEAYDRTVLRLALEKALARLTRRQRAVLVLRYYEDRSEAETARLLGCSTGTVKSQAYHAVRRLRAVAPELAELADLAPPGSSRGANGSSVTDRPWTKEGAR